MLLIDEKKLAVIELDENLVHLIVEIGEESGLSNWSAAGYLSEIQKKESVCLAALLENELIGFILIRQISFDEAEILNFAVREEFRQKGVGKHLLKTAIRKIQAAELLQNIWLEVRESNFQAILFYEKFGFKIITKRNNFYTHPTENALLMKLEIR